jgi:hypothetical protein
MTGIGIAKHHAGSSAAKTGCRRGAGAAAGGEARLQADWAAFLARALPPDAVHHHSPGEGRRGWRAQAALKSSGFTTGWPDSEIVWRGRVFFLELKAPGRRPTESQRACHAKLLAAGAEVAVGTTLDELYGHVARWGIPLAMTVEEYRRPRTASRMTLEEFRALGMAPGLRTRTGKRRR